MRDFDVDNRRTRLIRRTAAVLVALSLVALAAPSAFAAEAPVHSQDVLRWDDEIAAECGSFDVLATSADLQRNLVTWYDETGEIVRQIRRVHYDFTFVNTVTGKEADYIGHFVISVDNVAGTTRLLGVNRQLWVDGRLALSVAGSTTFTSEEVLVRGHSSLDEFYEQVCAVMA